MSWVERRHESAEVRALMNEIDRRDSPARKIERAAAARRMTLAFMRAGIVLQHPEWSAAQVERELIRRRLPRDLFLAAYGETEDADADAGRSRGAG